MLGQFPTTRTAAQHPPAENKRNNQPNPAKNHRNTSPSRRKGPFRNVGSSSSPLPATPSLTREYACPRRKAWHQPLTALPPPAAAAAGAQSIPAIPLCQPNHPKIRQKLCLLASAGIRATVPSSGTPASSHSASADNCPKTRFWCARCAVTASSSASIFASRRKQQTLSSLCTGEIFDGSCILLHVVQGAYEFQWHLPQISRWKRSQWDWNSPPGKEGAALPGSGHRC